MVEIKYFVHGTTTDNLEHKSTGWLPGILSEKGIAQGKELAEIIKNEFFDIVFCSDLKRAVESAKLNFAGRNIKILQDARLRECNYGDLDGLDQTLVVYEDHIVEPFPNGESLKQVESRIADFCEFLKKNYNGKKLPLLHINLHNLHLKF